MSEVFQIQAKDAVISIGEYAAINAVQSFDWDPAMNEENYSELGSEDYTATSIEPEVSGSFELTATGSTVAFLKQMIYEIDPDGTVAYKAGNPAAADNDGMIRSRELEFAVFDLIEAKKPNEVFSRSLVLPRSHLSSVNWTASSDGAASETYSFEGDLVEVYRAPDHDLISIPAVRIDETTVEAPAHRDLADFDVHYLMVSENQIAAADLTITGSNVEITGSGVRIAEGARVVLMASRTAPGQFPEIDYPTACRYLKADSIDLWLVPKSVDIDSMEAGDLNAFAFEEEHSFLRCQSVDLTIDLQREALRQIKKNNNKTSIYYRAATFPLDVSASLSALETNLKDWADIQGKGDGDVLNLADFDGVEHQIVVRYYLGDDVLQTMAFTDARVTGRGTNIAVGGRAEVTWNFTGSLLVIDGATV